MSDWPILTAITFWPLLGAIGIFFIRAEPEDEASNSRWAALWISLSTFGLSLLIWFGFERGTAEFQFVEETIWIPGFDIAYKMGVDGISMPFVLLSTLLTPICILASWDAIKVRVKEYMIAFLVLETMMVLLGIATHLGATGWLDKPVVDDQLMQAVREILVA